MACYSVDLNKVNVTVNKPHYDGNRHFVYSSMQAMLFRRLGDCKANEYSVGNLKKKKFVRAMGICILFINPKQNVLPCRGKNKKKKL